MRPRLAYLLAILSTFTAFTARADGLANAKVKAAEPPDMTARPPAELAQLKDMIGVWRCTGTMNIAGKEIPSASTYTVNPELDGFVYVGRLEAGKTPALPAFKSREIYGYDAGNHVFNVFTVDNMGGWSNMSSRGWVGDKQEWSGKARMMGLDVDVKQSVVRKGPREMQLVGSQSGGGPHTVTWNTSCKK